MFRRTTTSTAPCAGFAAVACCIGAVLAATASVARADPGDAKTSCLAGFELIVTTPAYCMSETGDVVEPTVERQSFSCPKDYEWLVHLCFNPTSGDVVLASEDREPKPAQRAGVTTR